MSIGDKMAYNVLDEALKKMDALIQEGYAVELRYAHGNALLIITEETVMRRSDPIPWREVYF